MKVYPDLALRYANESGRITTVRSRETYLKVMRLLQHAYPAFRVKDFTTDDLTTFCVSRYDGGQGFAAPSTQRKRRAHLRATFEWAQWRGYVRTNPAKDLSFTVRPGNGSVRAGNWLRREQVLKVSQMLDTDDLVDQRDRMIFLVAVYCGLRAFELAGLTWHQFNPELTELTFRGKGDKIATIAVPDELRVELARWRTIRHIGGVAVFPSFRWVMHPAKGKRVRIIDWDRPVGIDGVTDAVKKIGAAIGVPALAPHDLRRTFFGLLEEAGLDLRDIQNAGRHEHLATTEGYLQKNPARTVSIMRGFRLGI